MTSYSSSFLAAVERTLEHEGGYVDHKADPGGATNWGISLRFLRESGDLTLADADADGDIDAADIRALTRDQAIALYYRHFWNDAYDRLPTILGVKLFDCAVNMGPVQAHKLLQTAINGLAADAAGRVAVDGALGPKTVAAIAALHPIELLNAYRQRLAAFYRALVEARPRLAAFARGWQRRAMS